MSIFNLIGSFSICCVLVSLCIATGVIVEQVQTQSHPSQCELRSSWVEVSPQSDFSIYNIPFGIVSHTVGLGGEPHVATAIGEYVLDLAALNTAGLFDDLPDIPHHTNIFASSTLNAFMALPKSAWTATRSRLIQLLLSETVSNEAGELLPADHRLRDDPVLRQTALLPLTAVSVHHPVHVVEYTDFYSSKEHATNVGTMFRGAAHALQPNWLHLPVGYHGRASTVVLSGTPIRRPVGQVQRDPSHPANGSVFAAARQLDFELEMGVFLGGPSNPLGVPITLDEAETRIFGLVLVNDWSARDIQAWEYVPLGPFTSKNFATSISPWVVTLEALAPFRTTASVGPEQIPQPLEYLLDQNYLVGSFDVQLEVSIQPAGEDKDTLSPVCRSNYRNQYWNMKQQLVHHR
jgi:fumarylacetoacetase